MSERPPSRGFLQLCLGEPFRLFFPLGTLIGISGVSLWPLFFSGMHHSFYPGMMHGRLMIQGFLGAFVFGFLGTALPRLTSTEPLAKGEFWTMVALFLAAAGVRIAQHPVAGDGIFLALLLFFLTAMARRFVRRKDLPPPGFALVALGFGNAVAGTTLSILGATGRLPQGLLLGNSLLHVGWVLLLVLGIGGFLLPRFLGFKPRPAPDTPHAPPGWWPRAFVALAAGAIITGTLIAEVSDPYSRQWALIRSIVAAGYLLSVVPLFRGGAPRVTLTRGLRLSLVLLLLGLAFPLCWPLQKMAGLHVVFLGGFSLITFVVATRVVLGHSGASDQFTAKLPAVIALIVLVGIAAIVRAVGDFLPEARPVWLSTASYLWMLAVAIWSWRILPRVRVPDTEE